MTFQVNTSPFAGKEGKFVTSRQILDRLNAELKHNVALRVEETEDGDKFKVSGRGELHLGVLIENMRREGFELAVSRPEVIMRVDDGVKTEPMENVTIDVEEQHQGSIMEKMGERKADMTNMQPDGKGRIRMDFQYAKPWFNWFPYRIYDPDFRYWSDVPQLRLLRSIQRRYYRSAYERCSDF